ncbi:helix-turn-helix transcriptional regulator [Flavobacteriaceae bacterium]|jgi:DNA-binding HxlR family transcriptional regulator|nr:helix-turn-helix transcriptional regulator [Flavobacteriaceae bacterium]MDC0354971.1 helix-turn-helix transcriptional regulator [Flavobacteriaceae bacterium]MDC0382762.1 helix-turn-helix transcriptional regulator [Flavobacteriaceae bacterium]
MKVTKELCPVESFTEMLGGKWKLLIINTIRKKGIVRFGQLATSIPNISRKVLTDQLKSLQRDNLISRKQYQQIPPKVEYSLTKKADGLCSVFKTIEDWVNKF